MASRQRGGRSTRAARFNTERGGVALRPHYLLDREAQDAAAPMAGNGELGGVALWSASACVGYTGV